MYYLLAILGFGLLITIHELGHFIAAKASGVKVLEFSVGMGPKLLQKAAEETTYSLRCLPIGGYCAMEGEDVASDDPRAFSNQKLWKRLLILVAGSGMNFLLGFVLVCVVFAGAAGFNGTDIASFREGCPYEGDLLPGDTIYMVNGERTYFSGNFVEAMNRGSGEGGCDLVLIRDGKRVELNDYPLVPVEFTEPDGSTVRRYGINFAPTPNTFANWLRYSWWSCLDFVRMVRMGLGQLLSGSAGVKDMTGAVGMVVMIGEMGENASNAAEGLKNIAYFVAFLAVNLAVMNMLPIPALDGGHVFTLLLSAGWEKLSGRKPDPRIEGYIHAAGMVVLLGLIAVVMYNDVMRLLR